MPTTLKQPTIPDLTGSGYTQQRYLLHWHEHAKSAMHGILANHGADPTAVTHGTEHAALIADRMMAHAVGRIAQAKLDREIEAEKAAKTKKAKGGVF